ncbi:phage tail assembly chaperone family protein, TAC [Pseudomonas gingeri]|uniref:phage tail assembly chaperone family protein, TAC n=1 Tax=Pseudomonas gingeri TaxID=117681 RepID=UPI0015A35841|nr:phage tail assembly chaperone family protein, TAC [Pseudomonas gingeri]NWA25511.1 phage tail assembly chaperone family protein, TAC [Pseudomonas gingeri]
MELSIANLKSSKAFTSKPVQKEIVWESEGVEHKFTTFIRPLSYQTAVGDIASHRGDDFLASRIASSICDADGKAVFTVADLTGENDPERGAIDAALTNLLLIAIGEVQNAGKTKPSAT